MPSYREVRNLIQEPNYRDNLILNNQNTKDIISEMVKSYNLYSEQGQPLTNIFKSKTGYNTARRIHSFLRNNFRYEIEPDEYQTSKSLNRYIYDRYGDCKHYSLAIASILKANPQFERIFFRFVSYSPFKSDYHHVYVVALTNEGELIAIDPLQNFNTEKKYYYKLDKELKKSLNLENMSLSRLSGISECNSHLSGIVGKVLAAPSRNAFLLLVKLNPLNIGGRTKDAYYRDPDKLKNWWNKFGGSWASLEKAINKVNVVTSEHRDETIAEYGGETRTDARKEYCDAKYKWSISPFSKRQKCYNHRIDGIGADPGSTSGAAALLIAAAPVLIGLSQLLKDLGISQSSDADFEPPPGSGGGGGGPADDGGIMKFALPLAIGGAALLLFLKK